MIERRITFILGEEGIPAWQLNRLKTLAGYFRSVVVMLNVTQLSQANAEQTVRMMSLGCKPGDLCQLHIEGSDAELACMVLTDFISEQFLMVNTSGKKKSRNACSVESSDQEIRPFYLPFQLTTKSHILQQDEDVAQDKPALLAKLCYMLSPEKAENILELMLKREQVSSTAMGNGIALPHVMTSEVEEPVLAIIQTSHPIEWGSKRGPVTRLIAMVLPAPAQRPHLMAFSHFSRTLLEPAYCQLLTGNNEPEAIKALILHKLSRPFQSN